MTRYIAFLRGVNIGGHNLRMEDLRKLFQEMGFTAVRSYIQTGNIFFESPEAKTAKLQEQIQAYLLQKLGYEVPSFVRTIRQLEQTLASAPFDNIELTSDTRHLVIFISQPLPSGTKFPLLSDRGDMEVVGATSGEAYVVVHLIKGKYVSSNFLEKSFDVTTTSRFFHTTQKILEAAKL